MTRYLSIFALLSALSVLPLSAQEVRLPLDEFRALHQRANPEPVPDPAPPVPLAFERAEIEIEVGPTSARVVQQWTLVLFGDDWRSLALPAETTITHVDFAGADGLLQSVDDGSSGSGMQLRLRGEGRHRITVESALPVTQDEEATRDTWRLRMRLPAAALIEGTLRAHPGVVDVDIEADGLAWSTESQGRHSGTQQGWNVWRFDAQPGKNLLVRLSGPSAAPQRDALQLRFEAVSSSSTRVLQTRTEVTSWIEARVAQGTLERLRLPLEVPRQRGYELIEVVGAQVAGYEEVGDVLEVEAVSEVTAGQSFRCTVRWTGGPSETVIPLRQGVEGAAQLLALSKVSLEGDGLLELVDAGAARLPDEREVRQLPKAFVSAEGEALVLPTLAGSSADEQAGLPQWTPVWAEETRVLAVQVEKARLDILIGDAGQAFYRMGLQVASSGGDHLTVHLPVGARVLTVRRDGVAVTPGWTSAGERVAVTLPLRGGEHPQQIWLEATAALGAVPEEGRLAVPMPAFSAPVNRVEAQVQLPAGRKYRLAESGRRVADLQVEPAHPVTPTVPPLARWLTRGALQQVAADGLWRPLPDANGAARVLAAWDALASNLAPLWIEVEQRDVEREWF